MQIILHTKVYNPYYFIMENSFRSKPGLILQRRQSEESFEEYKPRKILPHINQEYQFRITNRILIEKIINPRRDKTIVDSLAHTACSHLYKKKVSNANQQSLVNFRRKLFTSSSIKKHKLNTKNNPKQKEKISQEKIKSNRCSYKVPQKQQEHKQKNEQQVADKIEDLTQPKFTQTFPISLRNNFIGKIVRNNTSRKQLSMRNNISNICDNFSFSSSMFNDNQAIERQAKWNSSIPFKRRVHQKLQKYSKIPQNKQNHDEQIQQQI